MTKALSQSLKKFRKVDEPLEILGTLGASIGGDKLVEVPNRPPFVYVQLRNNQNELIQAFNDKVSPVYNLPVIVVREGNRYIIKGRDTQRYSDWQSYSPFLPRHGDQHSFNNTGGGGDIVWVYGRQFMPMLVIPSGSKGGPNLIISEYIIKDPDGNWIYSGNTGTDNVIAHKPIDDTSVMGLVVVNRTTGNPRLIINSGTHVPAGVTGTSAVVPYLPVLDDLNLLPAVAFRLASGTASIRWDNLIDVRQYYNEPINGPSANIYFLTSGSSGVAGYDLMTAAVPTNNYSFYSASISATGTMIADFITEPNVPNATFITDGIYHLHVHAQVIAGTKNARLKYMVGKRTAGGVETTIRISELSNIVSTTEVEIDIEQFVPEQSLATTDRIWVRIFGFQDGTGSAPTVQLKAEGDTFSRFEIPNITTTSTGGGVPAGNNQEIQYNNAGAFGASPEFQWDNANKRIIISGAYISVGGFYGGPIPNIPSFLFVGNQVFLGFFGAGAGGALYLGKGSNNPTGIFVTNALGAYPLASIHTDYLSAQHEYFFPNKDGTIALLSDVAGGSGVYKNPGSVLFAGADGYPDEDNLRLFWDNTNHIFRVGPPSPSALLTSSTLNNQNVAVSQNTAATYAAMTYGTGTSGNPAPTFAGYRMRSTPSVPTPVQDNDALQLLVGAGYDGANFINAARIRSSAHGNWVTGTYQGSKMEFEWIPSGTTTRIIGASFRDKTFSVSGSANVPLNEQYKVNNNQHPHDGWNPDFNTWTFVNADAPSYLVTVNANVTGTIGVGMKAQLTHLGTDKNFIVTAISVTGSTTWLNLYGGTDYTLNVTGAITNPKYSPWKAPFGFPISPAKWTVSFTDVTERSQASPVQNTWYNLGSLSLSIPIGVWRVNFKRATFVNRPTAAVVGMDSSLSSSNNSESDSEFTDSISNGALASIAGFAFTSKLLTITSKTTFYPIARTPFTSMTAIYFENQTAAMLVEVVCAYL